MSTGPLALWAGVECTFNRVGDVYFDQCRFSGHDDRPEDLDLLADLGIKTLRYPVLWERHAPHALDACDFSWADDRLARLRARGVRPIAGLVHHGSGPRYTSLDDPAFPEKLAAYARRVAERYPWLRLFTPVNEPLTTARFAGLYGHWYPHGRDERTFFRCLLHQLKGTVLAMREIRKVIPEAQLVQTEDLAKIHSTPALAHQAEFENARRWVSFDLLAGKLTPDARLYHHYRWLGLDTADLDWFLENPCPPDILGTNYYVTSERFLDERVHAYPPEAHAGNHTQAYADVAACHVRGQGAAGLDRLLLECWDRYRLPIAVTEAHLGCTREEQVRWLAEIWGAAQAARRAGADVRAVTAWCAFGAYNWNSLVTRDEGHYEPGLFDLRAPRPRPTALARLCRDLAAGNDPDHPVADSPGWWRRPSRLIFPVTYTDPADPLPALPAAYRALRHERPILITGGGGAVATALAQCCRARGLSYVALPRRGDAAPAGLDITRRDHVAAALARHRPWAVINAAGLADVDRAEADPDACRLANVFGPAVLAETCAAAGLRLVTLSTDQVFNGLAGRPYLEGDLVQPLNEYGRAKAGAECLVLQALPAALVVRTGPLFGPGTRAAFVARTLESLAAGRPVRAAHNQIVSPTYLPDFAGALLDLLIDGAEGLWHLATPGQISWADFALTAAARAGLDPQMVHPMAAEDLGLPAQRPGYSALGSSRHALLPPLPDALERYFRDLGDPAFLARPCTHDEVAA
jgi:dTDP-4-dehydrorhamnose reductase